MATGVRGYLDNGRAWEKHEVEEDVSICYVSNLRSMTSTYILIGIDPYLIEGNPA